MSSVPKMRTFEVETEGGSVYHITPELNLWMRIKSAKVGLESLQSLFGRYTWWSGAVVGEPMKFSFGTRMKETRLVTSVRELEEND